MVHAVGIVVSGDRVRFILPGAGEPRAPDLACEAVVADRRQVTSSNGLAERRVFIRTPLSLAGLPPLDAEISLAARPLMEFPLLVGRRTLSKLGVLVEPASPLPG